MMHAMQFIKLGLLIIIANIFMIMESDKFSLTSISRSKIIKKTYIMYTNQTKPYPP